MPEKYKERKQMAKIICDVINKTKCKKCNYRCVAYEIADTLIKIGCSFTPERKEK